VIDVVGREGLRLRSGVLGGVGREARRPL